MADLDRIKGPSRDQVAEWLGISRGVRRTLAACLTISLVANVAQGVERWMTQKRGEAKVYVVAVDKGGNVLGVGTRVDQNFNTPDVIWSRAALEWLINVRGRSNDPVVQQRQNTALNFTTVRELWPTVSDWLRRAQAQIGGSSVAIEIDEVGRVDPERRPDRATIRVKWRERIMRPGASPQEWETKVANIMLARGPKGPEELAESEGESVMYNTFGIYVVYYQPMEVNS